MQHVQQLPLVFVNALDLQIEQRIGIEVRFRVMREALHEPQFVLPLRFTEGVDESAVAAQIAQLLELEQIAAPVRCRSADRSATTATDSPARASDAA